MFGFRDTSNSKRTSQPNPEPLVGSTTLPTIILIGACAISYLFVGRRLGRIESELSKVSRVVKSASRQQAQSRAAMESGENSSRVYNEALRGDVDRVAGDVKDVRSVVLKDRARLMNIDTNFDALSEQLKAHELRVLTGLASEQKRNSKTECEINVLRKTADQNAKNLSSLAVSLADVAGFIDRTEIEQGVLPEQGKESSKQVNALRNSALDVLKSSHKSNENHKNDM